MAQQTGVPDPPEGIAKRPIKPGESSARVRLFQELLRNRGFQVTVTGSFDKPTQSAYRVAQIALGFEPGRTFVNLGPNTWRRIGQLPRVKARPTAPLRFRPRVLDCRHGEHGMVRHRVKGWKHRSWSQVDYVLGHYTGNLVEFRHDASYHVNTNYLDDGGAPAIAYHIGIDVSGDVYVFNQHTDLTWHCDGGRNTNTLGIVFQGNEGGMTLAQRRSMNWLLRALMTGNLGCGYEKMAHRGATTHQHVKPTSCPGVKGEAQYRKIFAARGLLFDTTPRRGG